LDALQVLESRTSWVAMASPPVLMAGIPPLLLALPRAPQELWVFHCILQLGSGHALANVFFVHPLAASYVRAAPIMLLLVVMPISNGLLCRLVLG
jgi:hypothetical protein